MPGLDRVPHDVRTIYLGEFTHAHAETIAGALEARGIVWWYKDPGMITSIWERSVRMFVDRAKLDEARGVADLVLGSDA